MVSIAAADDDKDQTPNKEKQQIGAKHQANGQATEHEPEMQVKTFNLKNADPEEVQMALNQLWGFHGGMGMMGAMGARGAGGQAGMQAMMQGARFPGGGTAAGYYAAGPMMGAMHGPHVAVDRRTGKVFVRGTEKDVETVGDLINVLETGSDKEIPEMKNLHVYHLKHATPTEALQVLSALGLQTHVVQLPKAKTLLVMQSAPSWKQIHEVLTQLDVEGTTQHRSGESATPTRRPGAGQPKGEGQNPGSSQRR
jgi:type II secretory pathway component GspD/PulD (secretin)